MSHALVLAALILKILTLLLVAGAAVLAYLEYRKHQSELTLNPGLFLSAAHELRIVYYILAAYPLLELPFIILLFFLKWDRGSIFFIIFAISTLLALAALGVALYFSISAWLKIRGFSSDSFLSLVLLGAAILVHLVASGLLLFHAVRHYGETKSVVETVETVSQDHPASSHSESVRVQTFAPSAEPVASFSESVRVSSFSLPPPSLSPPPPPPPPPSSACPSTDCSHHMEVHSTSRSMCRKAPRKKLKPVSSRRC